MGYCPRCGKQLKDKDLYCPNCGARVYDTSYGSTDDITRTIHINRNEPEKSRLATLLLCIFVGALGIHRFYVGKIGTGILWLLTCGIFGIGSLVDLIMICTGSFTDSEGKKVTNWDVD